MAYYCIMERWKQGSTKPLLASEECLQAECFKWFHNTFPLCRGLMYHIPNGGLRSDQEANKMKAMGVQAGIPDICLAISSGGHGALYIEMKKIGSGRHSPKQIAIQEALEQAGNMVKECRTIEDFKTIVVAYLDLSNFKYK